MARGGNGVFSYLQIMTTGEVGRYIKRASKQAKPTYGYMAEDSKLSEMMYISTAVIRLFDIYDTHLMII